MMSRSFIIIIFLIAFLKSVVGASPRTLHRRKWITELFLEARSTFILDRHVNPQCRNDFKLYTLHLENQTVWAVRMLESSHWPTLGLLSGITTHLGNWAECLKANGSGVLGQYCLVQTRLNYTLNEKEGYFNESEGDSIKLNDASAWQVMQKFEKNPIYLSRLKLSWALCVPSSCSLEDISKSLEAILVPLFEQNGLSISINLESNLCSISTESAYPLEFYYMTLFYTILFVLVALSSGYYTIKNRRLCYTKGDILQCFSLEYNLKRLYETRTPAQYNLIYMIKTMGMVLVIGGHILLLETQAAMFQTDEFEKLFDIYQYFGALDSCVDVYLVISSFLLLHFDLDKARRGGWRFVLFKVASQWAKLSALISLHILFAINVWPYLGVGPLWKKMILSEAEKCRQNWWMNVLGIINLYPPENSCLIHMWYLSVTIQLSLVGGILLYAFSKSERIGVTASMTVFICGVLWTCVLIYSEAYNAIFLGYIKTLNNLQYEKDFVFYISTTLRVGPYVLGFIAAYFIYKLKQKNIVFSKLQAGVIFSTTLTVAILFAYYRKYFNIQGRRYNFLENAIYASFSRSFIVLPFVSFLCIYYTSIYTEKTAFNTLCQHKIWVLVGRLVPNAYLIHLPLLLSTIMSRRTYSPNNNELDIYWQLAAAVYYSFAIAFFWFLFIQSPLANVINLILIRLTSLYQSFKQEKNVNKKPKNQKGSENGEKVD